MNLWVTLLLGVDPRIWNQDLLLIWPKCSGQGTLEAGVPAAADEAREAEGAQPDDRQRGEAFRSRRQSWWYQAGKFIHGIPNLVGLECILGNCDGVIAATAGV